ncbi:hypothetical protein [Aureispira sp. CCB-E]|uniref:hypothetical protein n=1 Tax=Aureispira sp. CCB-E TaxID=3051121 RepID=UPI002869708B|nr:hypothetical protein [Aureispira sp. CCB-E]WMX16228.1 hypothetical protein QP953_07605 [Aureispira sp. CCB-E]WMX16236.1 hypothetical protein QP953_07645 [Aureispira sp. CCB-E]
MISIEARKIALAQALFDLSDENIITAIEQLVFQAQQQEDNWVPTEEEIQGIKDALKEVEEGKFHSEEEVKERFKKWLK